MEETVYKAPRAQEGRTGLVLEGGGMRGIYTAGVLDVFMENGIGFDAVSYTHLDVYKRQPGWPPLHKRNGPPERKTEARLP